MLIYNFFDKFSDHVTVQVSKAQGQRLTVNNKNYQIEKLIRTTNFPVGTWSDLTWSDLTCSDLTCSDLT